MSERDALKRWVAQYALPVSEVDRLRGWVAVMEKYRQDAVYPVSVERAKRLPAEVEGVDKAGGVVVE